jgi:hypothetical protein
MIGVGAEAGSTSIREQKSDTQSDTESLQNHEKSVESIENSAAESRQ